MTVARHRMARPPSPTAEALRMLEQWAGVQPPSSGWPQRSSLLPRWKPEDDDEAPRWKPEDDPVDEPLLPQLVVITR